MIANENNILPDALRKDLIRRTNYISEADRDTRDAFVNELAHSAIEADRKKFGRNDNDRENDNDHCKCRGGIVYNASASSEPVAYMFADEWGRTKIVLGKETAEHWCPPDENITPLYTSPQPLSESDIPAEPNGYVGVSLRDIKVWRNEWLEANDPRDGTDCVTPFDEYLYDQPADPVSKTNWSNELSSWSDEDFIHIFHERPDLANRLRKILAEPVAADFPAKGKLHGPLGWIANNTNPEPVEDPVDIDDFIAAFIARGDITKDAFLEARQWVRDTYYNPAEPVKPHLTVKYDDKGDCLYICCDSNEPADAEENDQGILLWRAYSDGRLIGVTIPNFIGPYIKPAKVGAEASVPSDDEIIELRSEFDWREHYGNIRFARALLARYG